MTGVTDPTAKDRRIAGPLNVSNIPKAPREETPPKVWPVWALKMREKYEGEIHQLKTKLSEMENAIVANDKAHRQLAIYNRQLDLEQLAMAVALSPRFKDLSPAEHRHVALVGFLSGLNPEFHLHAWKNKGKLTITPDYKALINLTPDPISLKERRLTVEEMRDRHIPQQDIDEGAIAYVVEGWNMKHMLAFRQAGAEYEPRKGYGWWSPFRDEVKWDKSQERYAPTGKRIPNDVPNGRDGEWVARKRATRDLYNQMADLRIKTQDIPGASVEGDEWTFEPNQENVVEGAFTITKTADWLKDQAKVDRARAYMAEQHVTDDDLNAALDMEDWTKSALTADEFKIVVDQIVVKKQMTGFMAGDAPEESKPEVDPADDLDPTKLTVEQAKPAPMPAPARNKPAVQPEASTDPETEGETAPPKVKDAGVAAPAPKMCKNCGLEPAVETPVGNDLCESCAKHSAK